jgi:hypothetical protein
MLLVVRFQEMSNINLLYSLYPPPLSLYPPLPLSLSLPFLLSFGVIHFMVFVFLSLKR